MFTWWERNNFLFLSRFYSTIYLSLFSTLSIIADKRHARLLLFVAFIPCILIDSAAKGKMRLMQIFQTINKQMFFLQMQKYVCTLRMFSKSKKNSKLTTQQCHG